MAEQAQFTLERLLDWLEGRLTEIESAQMTAAVADADPAVQEDVRWLRAFLAVGEAIDLVAPPSSVHDALMERFAAHNRRAQSPGFFQQLIAALTFDSNLQSGLAGARSVTNAGPRQLIYGSDYADVVINIRRRPGQGSVDLMGQILPHGEDVTPIFAVQLLQDDREIAITHSDDLGEFVIPATAAASYTLILSGDDVEIQIAPLTLSAA